MTPVQLNYLLTVAVLLGLMFATWSQIKVFASDLAFYQGNGWNLARDSGNKLFLVERMRSSMIFGAMPVGLLRLGIGTYFVLQDTFVLYGLFHLFMSIGAIFQRTI